MSVIYKKTGIISVIYKKGDKKITTEKQSAAIKNKTILHALSIICDVVDMLNKFNKSLPAISSKSLVEWIGILSLLICKVWIWS